LSGRIGGLRLARGVIKTAADRGMTSAATGQRLRAERARLSRHADIAKAMDYMLKRWPAH
jgi:hypothetical protein